MKLIEVVVLAGTHCISPVQHGAATTEVAKVECAVMVEKDDASGEIVVRPAEAAGKPEVLAVVRRMVSTPADTTRIEPAFAPPSTNQPQRAKRPLEPAQPAAETTDLAPPSAEETAAEPIKEAALDKPEPEPKKTVAKKPSLKKQAARKTKAKNQHVATKQDEKGSGACKGAATPQWYTNADGRRKYRCVTGLR